MAQVGPNSTQVDPKLAPHRLLIAFDCVHVAVCSAKLAPGSLHESPNTGKIAACVPKLAPRWTKLGPKTAQSRTNTTPSEPKLATSWPQDCMKADISRTYVKPTNSLGKTMIFHHNPIQIPSKSDSNPIQIRSNPIQIRYKPIQSDQVRSKSVPNPIQTGPNPIQPGPNPDPDGPWPLHVGSGWSHQVGNHRESSEIIANHESANRMVYPLSKPKCVVLLYLSIDLSMYLLTFPIRRLHTGTTYGLHRKEI